MIDLEPLARAGADAWDVWRDDKGRLHVGLDGVGLLPELELFAQAVARKCAELCESELEPGSVECADAIKEAFGLKD